MSPQLQTISDLIKNSSGISDAEKESLLKTIKEADKNLSMIQFKLERIEKDRNTLSVMLQESIEDLQKKSLVIEDANKALTKTLEELKATQAQLIQSEKMASLGELTAGIAHEIQNPLNFVNNFSEVSNELLDEMTEQLEKGNAKEAKAIANEVKMSLEKINLHGKRADGIVKSMLQHSRTSNNKKEPTDINVLADEYLRLAYHGLRAKDKSFNAALKTDYDENIGLIKIISQDIGRVILNLITNAFYAVMEKKKLQPEGYEPTVTVSTKKIDNKIIVNVKDNGTGIPQKALDKIFQPFFTTKPTGQGTGLGLSLSYDIVTKGHSGELKVETKEGEYTGFSIILPL
jgi:signal transduction histidine kinase